MATLYHQVWIEAPLARVYEAVATVEGLGEWWAPHTSTVTDDGLVFAHDPGERHGKVRLKVIDLEKNRRVEWEVISKHPELSPASGWMGTRILFEFSEALNPGGWRGISEGERMLTVLEFRHSGWAEDSPFLGFCNFSWGVVLGMLKEWCEKKDGTV
jgi:uncharacterized protein YndB with AHSA1/START domain